MKKVDSAKALEANLRGLGYPEIERALAKVVPEILVRLLDSRSIKIGSSAADLLVRSQAYPLIISAVLGNRITTKIGKIRAKNVLFHSGRQYPGALKAYLTLLKDRNDELAANALLALVLWGDQQVIPVIKERRMSVKSVQDGKRFELACEALEKSNPAILGPHFMDDKGVWA